MGRLWRVHHADLPGEAGSELTLERHEAHHVRRVLRLRPGERLAVFDGRGSEWSARIVDSEGDGVTVRLEHRVRTTVEAPLDVSLFQGLCRSEAMAWVVQKATEVGLAAICPLITERSEHYELDARRLERWRRISIEASKQCGRRRLPRIDVHEILPRPEPSTLALVLDPERGPSPGLPDRPPHRVWLAVGPEGGFSAQEVEAWLVQGWRRMALGPRTLRADTAGLVAAAIVLNRWGDLGSGPAVDSAGGGS